ncbi:MAG: ABC transporter permease subunit [Pseudomonadota bacterium]
MIGLLPAVRSTFNGFVAVVSMIPPLAVLPILFIVFGLGEVSKVALIAIGITPFLIRDLAQRTAEIPREQIVKAQTLGASTTAIALRVALPQLMPRLLQAVRHQLG